MNGQRRCDPVVRHQQLQEELAREKLADAAEDAKKSRIQRALERFVLYPLCVGVVVAADGVGAALTWLDHKTRS